ncbi:MAG: PGPGW domain-containing protein [Janthinobacterium lividum]
MSGWVDEQARPRTPADDGSSSALEPPHRAAHEDRRAWRRKIRSNPHQLRVYRGVVAAVGLLLILLGLATGWLPGPGGIPLILGGLAVWASEFQWAHRVMLRLKHALHVFRGWSRRKQLLAWAVFLVGCGLAGWAYLAAFGPPAWVPVQVDHVLGFLPGVDVPA